jgi:hypothetical protein
LYKTITSKGGDSQIFSNYGLCYGLKTQFDKAYKYIEAANYYANSDHNKAVVLFNKGLIQIIEKKFIEGEKNIKEARVRSEKEINKYIAFSDIVKNLRQDPTVDKIFM